MGDRTAEKLGAMFKESTGSHFLDSGGAYGRNWERNQSRDFEKEESSTIAFEIRTYNDKTPHLETTIVFNTYHWLKERLTTDDDLDRAMKVAVRFIRMANWRDGKRDREMVKSETHGGYDWVAKNGELPEQFELSQEIPTFFAAWKARRDEEDRDECCSCDGDGKFYIGDDSVEKTICEHCKGRGWTRSIPKRLSYDQKNGFVSGFEATDVYTVNTYNHECSLDQTIQFTSFTVDYQEYVVLQVHGGCDVRGGYTNPKLFEVSGEENCLHEFARATMYCTDEKPFPQPEPSLSLPGMDVDDGPEAPHRWDTENDGYDWQSVDGEMEIQFEKRKHWKPVLDLVIVDPTKFEKLRKTLLEGDFWTESEVMLANVLKDDDGLTYAEKWQKGKFCVIADTKQGLCPHCGGVLKVAPWP